MSAILHTMFRRYLPFYWMLLLMTVGTSSLQAQVKACVNAGIENNNFQNFTGAIGLYSAASDLNNVNSGLALSPTALPSGQRISIVTAGNDPNVPSLSRVYAGNYAIRLGSDSAGRRAERVTYTTPITNANKIFRYNYAVVLEIPNAQSHRVSEMPFFWARIMVGKKVICETGRKTAGTGDPFFQTFNGFNFRDWDCQVCDLTAYVGQTVTVEFTVASCSQGGHFGYAYIDGLCDSGVMDVNFNLNKTVYCLDEAITMDATATVGETFYYLTMEESDANGGRPNPASEMILHFPNQTVGIENLTSIFQSNGFVFKCNTYYRVKLAVGNTCSPWNELVKLIYISCPEVELGRDICVDCSKPSVSHLIPIGDPNASTAPHLQYQWSPANGISDPNAPYTTHMEHSVPYPITYTLHVLDTKSGCRNADQITIRCEVVRANLLKEPTCCGIRLIINAPPDYTHVQWSNGVTDQSEILVTTAGTYTVTYWNECSSVTVSETITAQDVAGFARYYTNLNNEALHSFYASPSNVNSYNAFYIMHVEDPLPTYGNYFATHYKLDIYNRWGEMIRSIEGEIPNCQGFPNPAIMWDGTVNGNNVQIDVYNGRLYLKNCQFNNEWKPVKVDYCEQWGYTCLDWDCEWAIGWDECGPFHKNVCQSWSNYHCVDQHKEYIFPINIIF